MGLEIYLSFGKVGLDFRDLRMAVLVQRVVPAAYAFVIHTHNPSTGAADEVYAEVVAGLGESIVSGLVPGSALGCVAKKSDLANPQVRAHANTGIYWPCTDHQSDVVEVA